MAVVLTVTAPGPAALSELWARLGGHHAQVDIVGDDISIHVDLTPEPEPVPDDPYGELTPEQEAQVEEVLSHPIHPEGPWEDAEDIAEPAPDADVVAIDRKARTEHPTGKVQRDTAADRVLAVLASDPTSTFTPADVAEELPDMPYGTLTGQLATLVRSGKVRRRGRGEYQAAAQ